MKRNVAAMLTSGSPMRRRHSEGSRKSGSQGWSCCLRVDSSEKKVGRTHGLWADASRKVNVIEITDVGGRASRARLY